MGEGIEYDGLTDYLDEADLYRFFDEIRAGTAYWPGFWN